jgi:serine phosphatase RsbU (regulator of sigma subunit)
LADKIATPLFTLNGNSVSLAPLAGMLLLLSIVFAVYQAALESHRRQLKLEQEFRSARELQQVLIPESEQSLPGYAFSSAYLPAAEVGGDFFQLIALDGDRAGSTLLVVGDVSGKGLKAAMSVAVIVGAVRTLTEISTSPAEILAGINRRLVGRMSGGLVTCLALRLDPDGNGVIANAGHLPPYLNGKEIDLPGALPLGLIPGISYDEFSLSFRPHDHLTLFTDGLLEARKQDGQLFGFERMRQLLANRPSAGEAAKAAVDFGQDDDITVLTLTRL